MLSKLPHDCDIIKQAANRCVACSTKFMSGLPTVAGACVLRHSCNVAKHGQVKLTITSRHRVKVRPTTARCRSWSGVMHAEHQSRPIVAIQSILPSEHMPSRRRAFAERRAPSNKGTTFAPTVICSEHVSQSGSRAHWEQLYVTISSLETLPAATLACNHLLKHQLKPILQRLNSQYNMEV